MYFGHNVSTDTIDRMEQTPANVANFLKKDQTQETVPYTIIQTQANSIIFNQSKIEIRINLSEPEITTKQGHLLFSM